MGGHDFTSTGSGKSAQDAYGRLCAEATLEFGEDPYNGTISTTRGFLELPEEAFKGLTRQTKARILDLLACEAPRELRRALSDEAIPGGKKASWEDRNAAAVRRRLRSLSPKGRAVLARLAPRYAGQAQKRENCLALKLGKAKGRRGESLYLFAGIAAS